MSSDSLSADVSLAHDPYERILREEKYNKNLIPFESSSKFAKKWSKFKGKLEGAQANMLQGAMMGFMVGGLFGFVVGCYSAVQTRRFMAIPISTIVSGVSFGFILGCGSMIRADSIENHVGNQYDWEYVANFNSKKTSSIEMWF